MHRFNLTIYHSRLNSFPKRKRTYSLLFYRGNCIDFTSKRKAFDFIAKLSHLFVEGLAICEMVNNTINCFSFHIRPNSKSNKDLYNVYHENLKRYFRVNKRF